jgi:PKD repeat protein
MLTKTNYVSVITNVRVVQFNSDVKSGSGPLNVNFTDTSSFTGTTWLWDFGDGQTSNVQHPKHTYANPGNYNVTLSVADSDGTEKLVQSSYVKVNDSGLYGSHHHHHHKKHHHHHSRKCHKCGKHKCH